MTPVHLAISSVTLVISSYPILKQWHVKDLAIMVNSIYTACFMCSVFQFIPSCNTRDLLQLIFFIYIDLTVIFVLLYKIIIADTNMGTNPLSQTLTTKHSIICVMIMILISIICVSPMINNNSCFADNLQSLLYYKSALLLISLVVLTVIVCNYYETYNLRWKYLLLMKTCVIIQIFVNATTPKAREYFTNQISINILLTFIGHYLCFTYKHDTTLQIDTTTRRQSLEMSNGDIRATPLNNRWSPSYPVINASTLSPSNQLKVPSPGANARNSVVVATTPNITHSPAVRIAVTPNKLHSPDTKSMLPEINPRSPAVRTSVTPNNTHSSTAVIRDKDSSVSSDILTQPPSPVHLVPDFIPRLSVESIDHRMSLSDVVVNPKTIFSPRHHTRNVSDIVEENSVNVSDSKSNIGESRISAYDVVRSIQPVTTVYAYDVNRDQIPV